MKRTGPDNRAATGTPGRVRIIGGRWRGRRINVPTHADLRPTPDRIRETLFNWLGQDLTGASCLDLFAGSGALGLEAASRGASRVVMVERDRRIHAALAQACTLLGAANVRLVCSDALDFVRSETGLFDVVFLDPPFRQNALPALLDALPSRLSPRAKVYVEAPLPVEATGHWRDIKRGRAGQVSYQLLEWSQDEQGCLPGNV